MSKKVTFSDVVETREMSIDEPAHIQEIKNPLSVGGAVADITSPVSTSPSTGDRGVPWWTYLIGLVILAIICYLLWRYLKG